MTRLLKLLFVLVVIIVAVGLYLGWFTVSSPYGNQGNKTKINLEIDRGKIKEDVDSLRNKAKTFTDDATGSNQNSQGN